MSAKPPSSLISITDDDIAWAEQALGLPQNTFDEQRRNVLKSMETIDVSACPGSGKTTLLVAKLAILARRWPFRTKGICVLSHTNVARHEIETRLGKTSEGQALLRYPHFVGTIDSFVDGYLAIPWLRSLHRPVVLVDTQICQESRWKMLQHNTQYYLEKNNCHESVMTIHNANYDLDLKKIPCGEKANTYKEIQSVCKASIDRGMYCYEEMFLWANELLSIHNEFPVSIRGRFPFLLIDEAQDNSNTQSRVLGQLFTHGDGGIVRQRFGDPDQSIFDLDSDAVEVLDVFPDAKYTVSVPNSHRFGQDIATLAGCLGDVPGGLIGEGPSRWKREDSIKIEHTIFLFSDDSIMNILPAFGHLILSTFTDVELAEGTFRAVGFIHKPRLEEDKKQKPYNVGDYWNEYIPASTQSDSTPHSFVEYIAFAQAKIVEGASLSMATEKLCEGFLRLARSLHGKKPLPNRKYLHRYIVASLADDPKVTTSYFDFLYTFIIKKFTLRREEWTEKWLDIVKQIVATIASVEWSDNEEEKGLLRWPSGAVYTTTENLQKTNIYLFAEDERQVDIGLGSIHSIKGETHTATLVLETFWFDGNLKSLLPCLMDRGKGKPVKKRQEKRRRIHYVAMTRPTHLLCLAIRAGDVDSQTQEKLEKVGWRIQVV
jgi:hypothetical protein